MRQAIPLMPLLLQWMEPSPTLQEEHSLRWVERSKALRSMI